MSKSIKVTFVILVLFAVFFILKELYLLPLIKFIKNLSGNVPFSYFSGYIIIGLPLFAGVLFLHRGKKFLSSSGLEKSPVKGLSFSLFCTFPMFAGYAIFLHLNPEAGRNEILIIAVAAPILEELFYRGILFGQIFRFTKIGFIPAVLISSILFAAGHIGAGMELFSATWVFLTTLMAGVLFSWLYCEWNYNLWVPVFLHMSMNLAWLIFSAGENASGGVIANIFRGITIFLVIVITISHKRRNHWKMEITKSNLWLKDQFNEN